MAYSAFDAMNDSAGDDMYVTGGAITASEYEENMTPADQKKYEDELMHLFLYAYNSDPLMAKYPTVGFKHWLTSIDGDDWRARAENIPDFPEREGPDSLYTPGEPIAIIQRLAHLHTGRIEDLITIVDSNIQVDSAGSQYQGPRGNPQPYNEGIENLREGPSDY